MGINYEAVEVLVESVIQGYGWSIYSPRAIDKGGAPMIEGADGKIRVPDTKASNDKQEVWVETKGKKKASPHHKTGVVNHGIDTANWNDYKEAPRITGDRVYLFFYETKTGMLFRRCIECLHVHHTHESGGGTGEHMTYFDKDELDRVPIRETMVPDSLELTPQINLYKDPEYIDFKIFPHEMDKASGVSTTLGSFVN